MNKITAIVLAAGNGSRMNSDTKKQFMEIKGKPILWYSLFAFEKSAVDQIILVIGKDDVDYCKKEIVEKYSFKKVDAIIEGGKERYESVYNGLKSVTGNIVLIHDGARPLINEEIINRCIKGAEELDACVAGMPVKDTIKLVSEDNIIKRTPDRSKLWITQTPQAFKSELIIEAYRRMFAEFETGACLNSSSDDSNMNEDNMNEDDRVLQIKEKINITDDAMALQIKEKINITDDAMVVEKYMGNEVTFVEGDYKNIKITTPEDILMAEVFLNN